MQSRLLLQMFRGLPVCVLVFVMTMSPAKSAELIEVPFGLWTGGAKGTMH